MLVVVVASVAVAVPAASVVVVVVVVVLTPVPLSVAVDVEVVAPSVVVVVVVLPPSVPPAQAVNEAASAKLAAARAIVWNFTINLIRLLRELSSAWLRTGF